MFPYPIMFDAVIIQGLAVAYFRHHSAATPPKRVAKAHSGEVLERALQQVPDECIQPRCQEEPPQLAAGSVPLEKGRLTLVCGP